MSFWFGQIVGEGKNFLKGAYDDYSYGRDEGWFVSGGGWENVYGNSRSKYKPTRDTAYGPYFKTGGIVPKTGPAIVHKGEMIIPVKDVEKTKKAMRKAKVPVPKKKGGCK
tara:strand:+ start:10354 stop:10683 length:330 start_codon:yes stop_codon:yes gene_type:complete